MSIKTLVADDHRLFVEGIRSVLESEASVNVTGFALNGRDAVEICKSGNIDLVLMDISMPVIDGIESTREIKRQNPQIKVIMVSMIGDYYSVANALKAGADGYILKNTDPGELLTAIKMVCMDRIYICKELLAIYSDGPPEAQLLTEQYIRFAENLISIREKQILKLIAEGFTDAQIAETLFLSDKTVSTHRKNMLAKLKLPNTAALVRFAVENRLV